MFNLNTLSNSLQVALNDDLPWMVETLLTPTDKNYVWSRVWKNVFGVAELRARVGRFDIPWNPKTAFPVPDLEQPFNKTLSEIYDQRAIEIYNRARVLNKRIVIMWSGGIDSTSMLCAFIKNLPSADLRSIIICATTESIVENPYFYETQIRGQFEMLHWRDLDFSDEFLDQHILLHGDPGDCIFGPSTSKYQLLWENNQYLKPWKDSQPILYQLYHDPKSSDFASWYVNKVSENLLELQEQGQYTNIKTISDWHWWNYYNLKWQGSMTRSLSNNKKNKKAKISQKNIQEFFDLTFFAGTDFQIWSYQNLSSLCNNELRDHKSQPKDYIFAVDKNSDYQSTKRKVSSDVNIWERPLVVDQDGIQYYHNDPGVIETFKDLLTQ
jgi:hypothetical protein